MSDDNKSRSWTDPITGEVYPSINPHISIQRGSAPIGAAADPLPDPRPDPQPERDVQPVPQPTPQPMPFQSAPRGVQPIPQPVHVRTAPRNVQPVPRPVQSNITRFCEHCGGVINDSAAVCPFCGGRVESFQQAQAVPLRRTEDSPSAASLFEPRVVINQNVINNITQNIAPQTNGKRAVNKWTAFFLCFFMGMFGIHHFYEGKVGMGILYLCTCGFFGIGVLVDLIRILLKPNPYYV